MSVGICDLAFVVNNMECRCMEIEQRREKMYEYEHENTRKCVIDQPGFTGVCLNEFVLDTASLGLKTIAIEIMLRFIVKVRKHDQN